MGYKIKYVRGSIYKQINSSAFLCYDFHFHLANLSFLDDIMMAIYFWLLVWIIGRYHNFGGIIGKIIDTIYGISPFLLYYCANTEIISMARDKLVIMVNFQKIS